MNPRLRYLLATACAVAAGLLTAVYLAGIGAAAASEADIVWVAGQEIVPGVRLSAGLLQRVEVDGPTRRLLARAALPQSPADTPEAWYATRAILPGDPLVPGVNVGLEPPLGGGTAWPEELRVVSLRAEVPVAPALQAGEEVDLYVVPAEGSEALRILSATRVVHADGDWVTVLVPEEQVSPVLAAADGLAVKVVRRPEGLRP